MLPTIPMFTGARVRVLFRTPVRRYLLATALVTIAAGCGSSDESPDGDDGNGGGGSGAVAPEPGGGSSGGSSGGDDFAFGEPATIAADLNFPARLAKAQGAVYVGVRGALDLTGSEIEGSGGAILRATASAVTTIAANLPGVVGIAARDSAVYWFEFGPPPRIMVRAGGGQPATLSDDVQYASAMVASGENLWVWDNLSGDMGLRQIDAGGDTVDNYSTNYGYAGDLVVVSDSVPLVALVSGYADDDLVEPSAFYTLPEPGEADTLRRVAFPDFVGLEDGVALDDETLVYTLSAEGTLNRAPVSDLVEGRVVLAADLESPWGVATDGVFIYVTERAGEPDWECQEARGRLSALPVSGGPPEVLAEGLMCPSRIEVTDEGVFWVNNGIEGERNGSLMVVPKVPSEDR